MPSGIYFWSANMAGLLKYFSSLREEIAEINKRNGTDISAWDYFWRYRGVRRHDELGDLRYWWDNVA